MNLKTIGQRSAAHSIFWAFLAWVAASLPQWADLIVLPSPWDGVLAGFAAFLAAAIRLVVSVNVEPSVAARDLPDSAVARLPDAEKAQVVAARTRQ